MPVRTTAPKGTDVKFNRSANRELLPWTKITIYVPSVYEKNVRKNIKLSAINGLEPPTHEKGRMPISNRLRPRGIFERVRCASGWSDIYVHSTNPVNENRVVGNRCNSCRIPWQSGTFYLGGDFRSRFFWPIQDIFVVA